MREMNKKIDMELPGRPRFRRFTARVSGETFPFYGRNVLKCIKSVYSDPELLPDLVFGPVEEYTDESKTERKYNEIHTGEWWWKT